MAQAKINDNLKKEIIAYYTECQNYCMTARYYGLGESTIRRIVKEESPENIASLCEQKRNENVVNVLAEMTKRSRQRTDILNNMLDNIQEEVINKELKGRDLVTAYGIILDKDVKINEYASTMNGETDKVMIPACHIARSFFDLNRQIDNAVANKQSLEIMLPGGRGSTKSSYWSEKVIELLENNPTWCALIIRRVANTLNQSVKPQCEWAIDKLSETKVSLKTDYNIPKSDLDITKKSTNQKIYLRGADDPGKIKSIKAPPGKYIAIIVYEEFDQLAGMEDVRKINQSIKRGGEVFIEFDVFNTPKSSQHFANKEMLLPKKDRIVYLTTYKDVPREWLGEKFIEDAEFLKEVNPKAYEHEYLGIATGDGGNVFENVEIRKIEDDELKTFDHIYNGVDWGWYPDPWAFTRCHYDTARKTLYIFDEHKANKKSNRETADILINEHGITASDMITCDSAEHKSTADYRSFGLFARDAEKGPGSVEYSMKWLASLNKIVIDPIRCPNTAEEFSTYEYERDKEGNVITGYPDKNNHFIDSIRYALEQIWKRRGL